MNNYNYKGFDDGDIDEIEGISIQHQSTWTIPKLKKFITNEHQTALEESYSGNEAETLLLTVCGSELYADIGKELILDIATNLINEKKVNVNCLAKYGKTPLMFAVENNQLTLIECLIEQGADVNLNKNNESVTPLFFAISNKAVQILCNNGADINVRNKFGETVLHHLFEKEYMNHSEEIAIIKILLLNGIDINAMTNNQLSPLHYKVRNYREGYTWTKDIISTAEFLLKEGADINKQNANGDTIAHIILRRELEYHEEYELTKLPFFKLIMNYDADPIIKNNQGKNLLQILDDQLGRNKKNRKLKENISEIINEGIEKKLMKKITETEEKNWFTF